MPTYEYICKKCGHEFEQFQSITAAALRKCPVCSKRELKRLLGCGSGVIFKGSGFYQTDYRSENYKRGEKSEKGTPDKSAKKKPESKSKDTGSADKNEPCTENKKKSA